MDTAVTLVLAIVKVCGKSAKSSNTSQDALVKSILILPTMETASLTQVRKRE